MDEDYDEFCIGSLVEGMVFTYIKPVAQKYGNGITTIAKEIENKW